MISRRLLAFVACLGCSDTQDCNPSACDSGLSIALTVERPEPGTERELQLLWDEMDVRCRLPASDQGLPSCDDASVRIVTSSDPGGPPLVVRVDGTPREVTIALRQDDVVLRSTTREPVYETVSVPPSACESECRRADVAVDFDASEGDGTDAG